MPEAEAMIVLSRREAEAAIGEAVRKALAVRRAGGELLDRGQVAELVGVSKETVRSWEAKGLPVLILPSTNGGDRGIKRYRRRDFERWLARHRQRKPPDGGRA